MPPSVRADFALEQYRSRVYAWAYRLLQNHDDALDVTQDVLVKWWRAAADRDELANPIGWLRRVTVNLAIDAVRAAKRRPTVALGSPLEGGLANSAAQRETAVQIAEALEALSERQRSVVIAKVYDGETFAQIAEQLGIAVPTVKEHYLRGLLMLRQKLARPLAG
jgi:RNA polymerase sigma-70 factor (ECF subfamily)